MGKKMKRTETSAPPIRPLLFRAATPRLAGAEIPGNYDPRLNVWIVDTGGVSRPIITVSDEALLYIRTTTKVTAETDDEETFVELSAKQLCELGTKTETQQESGDEDTCELSRIGSIAELATKTAHKSEADDDETEVHSFTGMAPNHIFPELVTKTDVQRESDDDYRFEM